MTTIINRTMQGARTPEGKIVSILLALSLSFMTWNAAAIESAYAYEGQDPAQAETVVEKPAGSEPASGNPAPEGNTPASGNDAPANDAPAASKSQAPANDAPAASDPAPANNASANEALATSAAPAAPAATGSDNTGSEAANAEKTAAANNDAAGNDDANKGAVEEQKPAEAQGSNSEKQEPATAPAEGQSAPATDQTAAPAEAQKAAAANGEADAAKQGAATEGKAAPAATVGATTTASATTATTTTQGAAQSTSQQPANQATATATEPKAAAENTLKSTTEAVKTTLTVTIEQIVNSNLAKKQGLTDSIVTDYDFNISKNGTKTVAHNGTYSYVGGANYKTSFMGVPYQFLNAFVYVADGIIESPVIREAADNSETIKKISNKGNGNIVITMMDGTTKELSNTDAVTIAPVYKATESWHLDCQYIDNVSTGSGSWSNTGAVTSYTHTFKNPEEGTPQEHYKFVEWQGENGKTYKAGDKVTFDGTGIKAGETKTVETYAVWQPSVTVNYYNWDGTLIKSVEQFEDIDLYASQAAPAIEGAEFAGWYAAADEDADKIATDTVYGLPATTTKKVDRTEYNVYAHYTTSYTVEHKLQGLEDEESYAVQDSETHENVMMGKAVSANPNEYEGFTYKMTESIPAAVGQEGARAVVGLVISLLYERNSYDVTYEYTGDVPADAPELPASASYKYGANVSTAPNAILDGYTFSGWSLADDFTMPAGSVKIFGSFTANPQPAAGSDEAPATVEPKPADEPTTDPVPANEPATESKSEPTTDAAPVSDPATGTAAANGNEAANVAAAAAAANPAPAAAAAPAQQANVETRPAPEAMGVIGAAAGTVPTASIADGGNALAKGIADDGTPLAKGIWSLFDVICTILAAGLSLAMLITGIGRNRKEDDEANDSEPVQYKRHRALRAASLVPGIGAIILMLLTQDFTQPMVIFDKWSVIFAVLAIVNIVLVAASRTKKADGDDNQDRAEFAPTMA